MIEERFVELKELIKKDVLKSKKFHAKFILKSAEVEHVYLFHQITYRDKTTYYLLIIAVGIGNEKL